jgi:hypothetical protein
MVVLVRSALYMAGLGFVFAAVVALFLLPGPSPRPVPKPSLCESSGLKGIRLSSATSFSVDVARFGPDELRGIEHASGPVARQERLGGLLSH